MILAWLALVAAALAVLAATVLPAAAIVRMLGGDRLWILGISPALGAAGGGIGAMAAGAVGAPWGLLAHLTTMGVLLLAALALRAVGVRLPRSLPGVDDRLLPGGVVPAAWLVGGAAAVITPILLALQRPDAVLQRWDVLYHLSALRRIRETGDASSLTLGTVANTTGDPATYPAAFHALASLLPASLDIPLVLNAAVLALALAPWAVGIAVLARLLWPEVSWGPFAAALAAILAPAVPLNLWIHLAPIPNLVGMAMLPGVLAGALVLWRSLLDRSLTLRGLLGGVLVLGLAGIGLALLQPNSAVMALVLIAVMTTATGAPQWRARPALALLPALAVVPPVLLTFSPLSTAVTQFEGGLTVPWWQALGEITFGLLTVWPMMLGVVIAALWWPGLVASWRENRWLVWAFAVTALMYLDAAVSSPLGLSLLFYRGQDRLAMPLMMLCALLVVPGVRAWGRALHSGALGDWAASTGRGTARQVVVLLAVVLVGISLPTRYDQAALNARLDTPDRPRFLQADELAEFERVAPHMDRDAVLLASPYTGGAHQYGLTGQRVRFPVAGMFLTTEDRALIAAVPQAATDPASCALLRDAEVAYLYQDWDPYLYMQTYEVLNDAGEDLGEVLFETDHSRLIRVQCDAGD